MRLLIAIMFVIAVFIGGCVGITEEKPEVSPAINATEEPFAHDLDTALEELDQIG